MFETNKWTGKHNLHYGQANGTMNEAQLASRSQHVIESYIVSFDPVSSTCMLNWGVGKRSGCIGSVPCTLFGRSRVVGRRAW